MCLHFHISLREHGTGDTVNMPECMHRNTSHRQVNSWWLHGNNDIGLPKLQALGQQLQSVAPLELLRPTVALLFQAAHAAPLGQHGSHLPVRTAPGQVASQLGMYVSPLVSRGCTAPGGGTTSESLYIMHNFCHSWSQGAHDYCIMVVGGKSVLALRLHC